VVVVVTGPQAWEGTDEAEVVTGGEPGRRSSKVAAAGRATGVGFAMAFLDLEAGATPGNNTTDEDRVQ
jgi:hypothetical protein